MFHFTLCVYLGFYIAFNTVQVISRRVVGRAKETSTYSWSRFCTVNCRPTASNYQLSHLRPCREPNPDLRGGRRECYHCATSFYLMCAYFKAVSYYFCVSGIKSTRNWRITYLFNFVLKFWGFSRFLFCVLLCLLILSQEKMPPGKIVSWKKAS